MIRIKSVVLDVDDRYEIRLLEDSHMSIEELLFFIEQHDDTVGPHGFVAKQHNSDAPLAPCLLIRSGHRICGQNRDHAIHRSQEPYT